MSRGLSKLGLLLLWLALTAGVAFVVAREQSTSDASDDGLTAPPRPPLERQTVSLEQITIQPVLSGDATVIADGENWNLEAPVTPIAEAYQLLQPPIGVKALITGGPAGFDCAWIGLGQGTAGEVTMRCRIPSDIQVVAGLSGMMTLQLVPPVQAYALPRQAVVGAAQQGQVVVVASDGTTSVRPVSLGVSDAFNVEVTSGLQPGESVLAAPVQLDFASE